MTAYTTTEQHGTHCLTPGAKESWLAVARRSRELAKEATK